MKRMRVKLEFVTPILGTCPANPEIYSDYIASNAPDAKTLQEEIADSSAQEVEEKQMTVFFKNENGNPYIYDYLIKGFFKNACKAMISTEGAKSFKMQAYKTKIDNLIFPEQRRILFGNWDTITVLQRPLRADTPQGPRVALSSSEQISAGCTLEFSVLVLTNSLVNQVSEWFDYGILNGLCQWHNGGYGRFGWQLLSVEDVPVNEGMKFMQKQYSYKNIKINELGEEIVVTDGDTTIDVHKKRRGKKSKDEEKVEAAAETA